MKFGAHVSITPTLSKTPLNAEKLGCECFQFFSQSPRIGKRKIPDKNEINGFIKNTKKTKLNNYYIHSSYLINLASKNNKIFYSSINSIKTDLLISKKLKAKGVITHIGSAKDFISSKSEKKRIPKNALDRVLKGFNEIFNDKSLKVANLIIENSAGSGSIIGSNLDDINFFLKAIPQINGICYDTAHGYASGIAKSNDELINKLKDKIGFNNIKVFHINNSKTNYKSYIDRHEHIMDGKMNLNFFKSLISNPLLKKMDFILETPHDDKLKKDLKILKNLRSKLQ